jgi:hypothetical protein
MTVKSVLFVGALTLASLGIASAKTYDITLDHATKAGANELKPGDYKLKVEGSQAVITGQQDATSVSVPVKVETSDKKFAYTTVETTNQSGMDTIRAIDLGGSNTRLAVGQ